jgi:hypothetical protein
MSKQQEIIEGEVEDCNSIVPISQERIDTPTILANIEAQKEIFKKLQEYVESSLVAKMDYYSISKTAKPSLGKSGAEKINFIFNLVPKYVILTKTSNDSEIAYELRCDLYNKNTGKFMGSGVGYCSSKEDKIQKSMGSQKIENVESVGNNIFKIAAKRSYVAATLSSTMASFIFTQDLEDGYLGSNTDDTGKGSKTTVNPSKDTKDIVHQKLDPKIFKVPFQKSKYVGMVLVECPLWWLKGQLKYVEDGKFIPSKFGYDDKKYRDMFKEAIKIVEKEDKELQDKIDKEIPK